MCGGSCVRTIVRLLWYGTIAVWLHLFYAAFVQRTIALLMPTPAPRPLVKLRSFLSSFLNSQLSRLAYALIRIDGERSPTTFSNHRGVRYAYENIVVTDIFAPWAIDTQFLAVWNQVKDYTLVDIFRCYELYQLIREVADIPGDILEV